MGKLATCNFCKAECQKRQILCAKCWDGLADKRKQIIRKATYRRDEIGKKFLTELLTTDLNVIGQMIADSNGKVLEPTKGSKFPKSSLLVEVEKKEAEELI
jgi:hypothetical protein